MTDITVGAITYSKEDIDLFPNRKRVKLKVKNTGDRPIQVGSHYHFFETNRALDFDRIQAYGMRLDLAAGTSVRFEPGQSRDVTLVEFGGNKYAHGFNNLTDGSTKTIYTRIEAIENAKRLKFRGI